MASPVIYRPLNQDKKEIRILYVEVEDDLESSGLSSLSIQDKDQPSAQALRFRLDTISLLDPDIRFYEAISCRIGDPKVRKDIYLNDHSYSITAAAERTLRGVCEFHGHTPIWIDSVCVNQDDQQERTQQADLIDEIYARAARSLVWIPQDTKTAQNTAVATRELRDAIGRYDSLDWRTPHTWSSKSPMLQDPIACPVPEATWKTVYALFAKKWFSKTWLIREAALSKQVVCYLGSRKLLWTELSSLASWLAHQKEALPYSPGEATCEGWTNLAVVWLEHCSEAKIYSSFLSLATPSNQRNVIKKLQRSVLSFQGKTDEASSELSSVSASEDSLQHMYARAARAAIQETRNLTLLKHAHSLRLPPKGDHRGTVPSWALRLDLRDYYCLNPIIGQSVRFKADESVPLCMASSPLNSRTLSLQGVVIDMITDISARINWPLRGTRHSDALSASIVMRRAFAWTRQQLSKWPEAALARKFAITVAAGQDAHGRDLSSLRLHSNRLHRGFMNVTPISMVQGPVRIETPPVCTNELDSDAMYAIEAMMKGGQNRTVFITDQGKIGSGTDNVQPGDMLCILFGGDVPFILRPCGAGWQFVGDAFVEGIMFGGHIHDLKISGRFQKEIRWFNIE